MTTAEELACVYSSLLLHDSSSPVTADRLQSVLMSAGVQVKPQWSGLFAKALETLNLEHLVSTVTRESDTAAPATSTPVAAECNLGDTKHDDTREETKQEDDQEMSSLRLSM